MIQIKHKLTGAVLKEVAYLRDAYLSDADLRGADLSGADLSGAYLSDADLRDADLRGADLRGAYLSDADLRGAYLRDAYLSGADLRGADLRGADLRGADLSGADLSGADLSGADLSGAYLRDAYLRDADLRGAQGLPDAPIIPHLDAAILARIGNGGKLEMGNWHTCETTHCRAGWAIILAGEPGSALEKKTSSDTAGRLIYLASRPGKPAPDFYANNEDALADLRECAAKDPLPQ